MTQNLSRRERIRQLRDEALAQARDGHPSRALAALTLLEKLEPKEPDWPRRSADCHRALGDKEQQIEALGRAAEHYMEQGITAKAIAMCKVILSLDPKHTRTQARLLELQGGALAGVVSMPIPASPAPPRRGQPVAAPRAQAPAPAAAAPPPKQADPLPPGTRPRPTLDEVLRRQRASKLKASPPARAEAPSPPATPTSQTAEAAPMPPPIAAEAAPPAASVPPPLLGEAPVVTFLSSRPGAPPAAGLQAIASPKGTPSGMFRISLDEAVHDPKAGAQRKVRNALPTTRLFSELSQPTLERLIERAELVQHDAGSVVYRKDDASDALYVIVSGAVAVIAEGDPRVEVNRLGENEFFGETALISNELRLTTVETTEPTELLRIDRSLVTELIQSEPATLQVVLRFLRERLVDVMLLTNPLFTILSKDERRALAERFEFLQLDRGSLLIEQGEPSPGLYVLLCGTAEVTRRQGGGEHLLALLHAGSVCGEMSLLDGEHAIADVRSVSKGFALLLPVWEFREAVIIHPQIEEFVGLLAASRRVQNAALLGTPVASPDSLP